MKSALPFSNAPADGQDRAAPVSRLHAYCGGLMEACWLAAVVLVPLAYNPHGVAGFQPFKMAFVRLIASVLACAWAIRAIEGARRDRPVGMKPRSPRLWVALWAGVGLLTLTHAFAGIFSVDPIQSFWGFSPNRAGFVSLLAELVIFAAVAMHLRSPAQMDRLTAAIILPTIPIGLFAIAQSLGFDPLSLDRQTILAGRGSVSLAGHQISLAAHLCMVIPFTLARIHESVRSSSGGRRLFPVMALGAILLLQLTGVLLARSRGPLLALLVAVAALIVAWAALEKRRALLQWGGLALLGVVAFLAILSIPGGPLARLARLPVLDRFASAVPVGQAPDGFRTGLWSRAPGVVMADAPFTFPDGRRDLPPGIRSAIGFGPESLQGVLPQHWTWIDPALRLEKSFHNLFWDSWFSVGAFGAGAMLLLFAAGILLAFRPVGFRPRPTDAVAGLLVGILICLGFAVRFGAGYLGLGVQAGLAGGLVAALACFIIFPPKAAAPPRPSPITAPPVIAAGAALVAHLIETAFAFQWAASALLFWICLGIVAANARQTPSAVLEDRPPAREPVRPWALPLLAGLAATALIFAFVHLHFLTAMSWWEVLSMTLARITGTPGASHLMPLVLLPTLAMFGAFAAAGARRHGERNWPAFLRTTIATVALASGYALLKAGQIAAIGPLPGPSVPAAEIVRQAMRAESLILVFLLFAGGLLGLLGWACARRGEPRAPSASWLGIFAIPALAVTGVMIAYPATLRYVLADTAAGSANLRAGSPDLQTRQASLEVLARAIRHDPSAYDYRLQFADMCQNLAALDSQSDEALLKRAADVLTAGLEISPLSPINYALARLEMTWALAESRPEERQQHAREARRHFQQALRFDPMADHIWVESAAVAGGLLGDREADETAMRSAMLLIEPDAAGVWAEAYAKWSVDAGYPLLKQRYAERGIFHFQHALESATRQGARTFHLLLGKGTLHRNLGQLPEALADFRAAAAEGHAIDAWRVEAMLAHTLSDLGDNTAALPHVARALESAPREYHEALNQLRAQLQNQ